MDHSCHHQASMASETPMHHGHDMPMPGMPMCSMNMIFNWQIENVCVVFESWHIQTWVGMVLSCAMIFAIAAGYEYISAWTSKLEQDMARADGKRNVNKDTSRRHSSSDAREQDALLPSSSDASSMSKRNKILRSTMYALLMAISFWLMLVFMTYNGYLMIATILGAGVGHYVFGQRKPAARSISCH